jgi:hypothetical protein
MPRPPIRLITEEGLKMHGLIRRDIDWKLLAG